MTPAAATGRADGTGLLERAIGYALGTIGNVTPELLASPTPCRDWNLGMLLAHVNDGLAALGDGIRSGHIGLAPEEDDAADPAQTFRDRAARLLAAWSRPGGRWSVIAIGGMPLAASTVASTGAVEIAVHGWDIGQACGQPRPVPDDLASALLEVCPLLVRRSARYLLFDEPVEVPPLACPSDRLVAFLGRDPGAHGTPRRA